MAAKIKAIDAGSVHRIHSGQVVLDLQSAIKELVENSLDAGATSIDVRIKDHGLDTVEVLDNGSGIAQPDWPSIGLKHHTSKLPSLEELAQVSTFGFRGEALSALCALSESVTVVTSTKETAPMGAIITLGRNGHVLDDTGKVARQRGTTITLSGLFKPLPVRRKEFERTAKREFTKALGILTAYALVPASACPAEGKSGVRLKVESIGAGKAAKRNTVLATDGRGSLRSSVSAVWGPKALEGVVDIDVELDVAVDKAMARREGIAETSQTVRVTGLISSGAWGQGRSSADRQFTFINGRPCALPKVSKAVNEVYKNFNTNQVPLAILDFQIPKESVDINVSPDKRTIFVHSEANLIEALRTSLETFFQPTRSSYAVGGASSTKKLVQSDLSATQAVAADDILEDDEEGTQPTSHATPTSRSRRTSSRALSHQDSESEPEPQSEGEDELSQTPAPRPSRRSARPPSPPPRRVVQQTLDTTLASWSPKRKSPAVTILRSVPTRAPPTGRDARANLRQQLAGYASQQVPTQVDMTADDSGYEDEGDDIQQSDKEEEEEEDVHMSDVEPEPSQRPSSPVPQEEPEVDELDDDELVQSPPRRLGVPSAVQRDIDEDNEQPPRTSTPLSVPFTIVTEPDMDVDEEEEPPAARSGYRDEIQSTNSTGEVTLRFDAGRLRERFASRRSRRAASTPPTRDAFDAVNDGAVADAAGVGNRDAEEAEAALARVISKDDFEIMEVLGQFNKGFIIARLRHPAHEDAAGSDDLFIVDQHASDEKFNFETLQRTTVIKAQSLIRPRPMQLTAADEIVAMENLDVLHANGFDVDVDEDAAPGRGERVALKAMPVSKETTFDFKDLEQLLHLLSDSARPAGQMVRCTKARSMFAMRACRKSVMIGKSLTKAQMVTLLRNMGTIDQPWNCPHGRPTMRHLCALTPPTRSRAGRDRIDWSEWS